MLPASHSDISYGSLKNALPGVQASSAEQYGQYENFMMLGKDALWAMLVSTLVANDLFLIGQKCAEKAWPVIRWADTSSALNTKAHLNGCIQFASQAVSCDGQVTSPRNARQFTE